MFNKQIICIIIKYTNVSGRRRRARRARLRLPLLLDVPDDLLLGGVREQLRGPARSVLLKSDRFCALEISGTN